MAELAGPTRTIAVVGGLGIDTIVVTNRLPRTGETYKCMSIEKQPGGKGANSAVAAFRLSHYKLPEGAEEDATPQSACEPGLDISVYMSGAVGKDSKGARLTKSMARNFVNTEGIRTIPLVKSARSIILFERALGENRILYRPGANHELKPEDFMTLESICKGQKPDLLITQLELESETVTQVISTARLHHIPILLNPAPAQHIESATYQGITHLIANEIEAAQMTGRRIEEIRGRFDWNKVTNELLEHGVKNVVVTLGARGAFCSDKHGQGTHINAVHVEPGMVVDTSGAGDTFVGAYAVDWIRQVHQDKWDLCEAVRFACRAAACTIQRVGCQESIPWADELELT